MTAPTISLAEAARICGVSQSTLRRRRAELLDRGAVHGPKGWKIPIPALIELGLLEATTAPDVMEAVEPPAPLSDSPVEPVMTPAIAAEVEALRGAVAALELRAAVAEAVAAERERIIDVQAQALRMLEASPETPTESSTEPSKVATPRPSEEHATEPPRRSWWPFGRR